MQHSRAYDIDDQDRAYRLREMSAGADNVLRLALGAKRNEVAGDEFVRRAGRATVELLNQAADSVKANEARAEALMQKAIDQLTTAEARIREFEARTAQAEARAAEAEAWVRRVHQAVLDRFQDVRDIEPRRTQPDYAA